MHVSARWEHLCHWLSNCQRVQHLVWPCRRVFHHAPHETANSVATLLFYFVPKAYCYKDHFQLFLTHLARAEVEPGSAQRQNVQELASFMGVVTTIRLTRLHMGSRDTVPMLLSR